MMLRRGTLLRMGKARRPTELQSKAAPFLRRLACVPYSSSSSKELWESNKWQKMRRRVITWGEDCGMQRPSFQAHQYTLALDNWTMSNGSIESRGFWSSACQ